MFSKYLYKKCFEINEIESPDQTTMRRGQSYILMDEKNNLLWIDIPFKLCWTNIVRACFPLFVFIFVLLVQF